MTSRCVRPHPGLLVLGVLVAMAPALAQDLRPTDLSCTPPKFRSGQDVTIQSTIKNIALLNRAKASEGAYVLSQDPLVGNKDDVVLATFNTPALDANESDGNKKTVTMPNDIVSAPYWLFVVADYKDVVNETVEINNARDQAVEGTATDLTATVAVAGPLTAGTEVELLVTIANIGTLDAPATTALLFLSPDPDITLDDVFLKALDVPAVHGLKAAPLTPKVTPPFCRTFYSSAGETYLGVIVNPMRSVTESDYGNNGGRLSKTVNPATSGRILEWRPRYNSGNIGPNDSESARFRLAQGVDEKMCITAPSTKNQLYLLLWSGTRPLFTYDDATALSIGSLNSPMFAGWFGVLNGEGVGSGIGFHAPKFANLHGFTIYTHHVYITPNFLFTGFGENQLTSAFVQ